MEGKISSLQSVISMDPKVGLAALSVASYDLPRISRRSDATLHQYPPDKLFYPLKLTSTRIFT